jgi:hypothetical protein
MRKQFGVFAATGIALGAAMAVESQHISARILSGKTAVVWFVLLSNQISEQKKFKHE